MMHINALAAWDVTLNSTSDVAVAILDSGVNWNHPDLLGRVVIPYADGTYGNCISPGTYPMDDNGHGTMVAGIVGAAFNNGVGIAGLVNTSSPIVAIKVFR